MSFKFMSAGCASTSYFALGSTAAKQMPAALWLNGDTPYMRFVESYWATGTIVNIEDQSDSLGDGSASDAPSIETYYEQFYANPGLVQAMASAGQTFAMLDDHEVLGNNWDHTIETANAGSTALNANTGDLDLGQQDVINHWKAARQAWVNYVSAAGTPGLGNNPPADASATGEIPPGALLNNPAVAPDLSDYDPLYFTSGWDINGNLVAHDPTDFTNVHCMTYTLDCVSHKSISTDTDTTAKLMLGANQRAHILSKATAADSVPFHIFMSSKTLFANETGVDGWGGYSADRDDFINELVNVIGLTGIVWICGDEHRPMFAYSQPGSAMMSCNPMNRDLTRSAVPHTPELQWEWPYEIGSPWHPCYGLIEVEAGYVRYSLRHPAQDREEQAYRINIGSNVPVPG